MTSGEATGARSGPRAHPPPVVAVASLSAAIVVSGIQGIAPALPGIQEQFGLTAAQLALVTSIYLFPSMFSSLAAGVLADRIGARPVFAGSLLVFGLAGGAMLAVSELWALLALRFVQGAAMGAVLSLSIAVIGAVHPSGPQATRAQGRRAITMAGGEALFPVTAGLLLALSWSAPFAMQLVALPAAVAAWVFIPSVTTRRRVKSSVSTRLALRAPAVVAVQSLGGLRFLFKFALWTYYPLLATGELGMSPAVVGAVLGGSSVLTALTAWWAERLAHRWTSSQLIGGSLVVIVVSLLAMAVATEPVLLVVAMLLYGAQDGVYSVAHNVLATELSPPDARSTYIGLTGTTRNVGKFVAPLFFGAMTLALSLSQSLLVLAGMAGLTTLAARSAAAAQAGLPARADDPPGAETRG